MVVELLGVVGSLGQSRVAGILSVVQLLSVAGSLGKYG